MAIEWTDDMKLLMQRHLSELHDLAAPFASAQFQAFQQFLDDNSDRHNDLKLNTMAHMYAKGLAMLLGVMLEYRKEDAMRMFEAAFNDTIWAAGQEYKENTEA